MLRPKQHPITLETEPRLATPEFRLPSPVESMIYALQQEPELNSLRKEYTLHGLQEFQIQVRNAAQAEIDNSQAIGSPIEDDQNLLHAVLTNHAVLKHLHIFGAVEKEEKGNQAFAQNEKRIILETLGMLPEGVDKNNFVQFCLSCPKVTCHTNEEMIAQRQKAVDEGKIVALFLVDEKTGKTVSGPSWCGFRNQDLGISAAFTNKGFGVGIDFSGSALLNIINSGSAELQ